MPRWSSRVIPLAAVLLLPALAFAGEGDAFEKARSAGWLWAFLAVFGAGVLTSLTPCVYPMIPIVMGIFGARGENVPRGRAVLLAAMYVSGMGLMYAILGVAVAMAGGGGSGFGAFLANPWVVFPLVAFYLALAASMFGAFELNLPSALQQRLAGVGGKGVGGAFAMGMVGGFTAAPCTGPMLLGILTYVATTGNAVLGFTLLFTYAVGMGMLFFAIALFAVSLPKSGRWMDSVKSIAGVALLVMGVYFLRPVVPALASLGSASTTVLAVGLAVAVLGIALGSIHLTFGGPPREKARKSVGVLFTVVGASVVLFHFLTPELKLPWRERCNTATAEASSCFTDDAALLAQAKAEGKPVLIDFGATWCLPCKKYETDVFADAEVHRLVTESFVPVKFDVSDNTDADTALQDKYQAGTLPTVILLDAKGREVRRFGEPIPSPREFLEALEATRRGEASAAMLSPRRP
jgi:thiol:disulfide interchange protein DsbD